MRTLEAEQGVRSKGAEGMRILRLILEFSGLLVIVWLALEVNKEAKKSITLPHRFFYHEADSGRLHVRGTWVLEDDQNAWPDQFTIISCDRSQSSCNIATAIVVGREQLLMSLDTFSVSSWSDETVVIEGTSALCIHETYQFNLRTETASGSSKRREDVTDAACGPPTGAKRLRLIDGRRRNRI